MKTSNVQSCASGLKPVTLLRHVTESLIVTSYGHIGHSNVIVAKCIAVSLDIVEHIKNECPTV